jgi:hypothetical protein
MRVTAWKKERYRERGQPHAGAIHSSFVDIFSRTRG